MRRKFPATLATTVAAAAAAVGALAAGPSAGRAGLLAANRCVAVKSAANGRFVALAGTSGYRATSSRKAAEPFFLKPTGLGTYLIYDRRRELMSANRATARVGRLPAAGPLSEWAPVPVSGGFSLSIKSTATGRLLSVSGGGGALSIAAPSGPGPKTEFTLEPDAGCTPFPEAEVGATGALFKGTTRDGTVFGFVDAHLHITGNMRAGGRVIYGEAFNRFGIPVALGQDAAVHGSDGGLDVTGNLLRRGLPTGGHDTHGWPTFAGWPTYNTQTHQQVYYVWLQRAWEAGERLVVAQTVDDQAVCRIEPRRNDGCDETHSITRQIRRLKELQDYVDAQNGGPGRGWFRLVYSPDQARRVIERGRLAVIIGIESSDLFGCSERSGIAQCTRANIDRGLREYKRLGVRGMFVAHWFDNAFAGAALEGGARGIFINILNRFQTGSYFKTGPCPGAGQGEAVVTLPTSVLESLARFFPAARSIAAEGMPSYPPGPQCNTRGLTALGRYLIKQLIAEHMLIEVDHLSEKARDTVLSIAERAHYPLISSHNGTGGEWTPAELVRLYRLGGFAAVTPDMAPALAAKILRVARYRNPRRFFGVGLGTDTNGLGSQPGPRPDAAADPLRYPFKSFDGKVTFAAERTGQRTFDLNTDGVAQYGLFADLLADVERRGGGRGALSLLFRSAEAYLQTWQRAFRHR